MLSFIVDLICRLLLLLLTCSFCFYSAAALLAMQSTGLAMAIPSVCLSVCLSVRYMRVPYQTNEGRIMWSPLWGSKSTLSFWYQQWLEGDIPFHLKCALKVTHRSEKCRLWPMSAYNVSTIRASEKVRLSRIGTRLRTFQRAIGDVRTLPLTPPKCGSKREFCHLKTNSLIFP